MRTFQCFVLAVATASVACGSGSTGANAAASPEAGAPSTAAGLTKINHVVVIVLENWSFDSLYAEFDGAEGLAGAMRAPLQIDPKTGQAYTSLPQTESHLPQDLPNAPFALDPFIGVGQDTSLDLTTKFYQEQAQIHAGTMNQFVGVSAAKGLTMGFFHTADLPLAAEAKKYTLCDHFFHGVYGGSLPNHIFLISAAVARFENAPTAMRAVLDANVFPSQLADGVASHEFDGHQLVAA